MGVALDRDAGCRLRLSRRACAVVEHDAEPAAGHVPFPDRPVRRGEDDLAADALCRSFADFGTDHGLCADIGSLGRDDIAHLRRRVGVVHQDAQFLDHLPVAENVALPLSVAGQNVEIEALRDLLGWVQLAQQARSLPPSLSGGERQRAALARAVILSPDLILADEPTGNLDWDMSMRLMQLLIELNKSGKTVLVATHDLNLIRAIKAQVAARVLRIAGGTLQLAGSDL